MRAAQEHGDRVVRFGQLVFFSTETGDAWMLDPADGLARCLARDGVALPAGIVETPDRFGIEWNASYPFIARRRYRLDHAWGFTACRDSLVTIYQ